MTNLVSTSSPQAVYVVTLRPGTVVTDGRVLHEFNFAQRATEAGAERTVVPPPTPSKCPPP